MDTRVVIWPFSTVDRFAIFLVRCDVMVTVNSVPSSGANVNRIGSDSGVVSANATTDEASRIANRKDLMRVEYGVAAVSAQCRSAQGIRYATPARARDPGVR